MLFFWNTPVPHLTHTHPIAHSLADNRIDAEAGIKLAEAFKEMPNLTSVK